MSRTKKFSLTTTVSIARNGTKSLRVTIPQGIVAFLDLESGSKISWVMENNGSKRWLSVRKVK